MAARVIEIDPIAEAAIVLNVAEAFAPTSRPILPTYPAVALIAPISESAEAAREIEMLETSTSSLSVASIVPAEK